MNTASIGKAAEKAVAEQLTHQGYKIVDRNWRRRTCEIDIVAMKDSVVYFVEVKHRTSQSQGSGLEYITVSKLKQMRFAAEMWVAENSWQGDYRLMAAEVAADSLKPKVTQLVEI